MGAANGASLGERVAFAIYAMGLKMRIATRTQY
jgi:hypothetical protein